MGDDMDDDRIETLLLQLIQDMAEVKAKINNIDEQRLSSRLDLLEAQTREQERIIKALEHRSNAMEEFVRGDLNDNNKANKNVWVSIGIAMFTAVISFIMNLI